MSKYIVISNNVDLLRVSSDNVVYFGAEGNYCKVYLADGNSHLLSFQIGKIEEQITMQMGASAQTFLRIGRSNIINSRYVYYVNPSRQNLIMSDGLNFRYSITSSRESLSKLKEYIESMKNEQ